MLVAVQENWRELAAAQAGLLSYAQLRGLGLTGDFVRHQFAAQRWVRRTHRVVGTTTGPLTWEQRLWQAVLHAGGDAVIGGLTAAGIHGMKNWYRDEITVLVSNPLSFQSVEGVRFFRTRRLATNWRATAHELPVAKVEPAILLFAAHERHPRTAQGALAAAVQQRLTTTEALRTWLERLKPLRQAARFRRLLADLEGGAQSLAEVDLRKACREYGIKMPKSQKARTDRSGKRRYTDAEWTLPDGRILVLEVDGAFHDDVHEASAHRARNRKLATTSRIVISCSAVELRDEPWHVMEDLIALGVPRTS